MTPLKVLVVGVGQMGLSHALGYAAIDGWNIAGMVVRDPARRQVIVERFPAVAIYDEFDRALAETERDAVSINTYPDTHARFAIASIEAGAHVFVEKPLASTVEDAVRVVEAARRGNRKLVVGYILNHHPSWKKFVELTKSLGRPLVMRMNLLQQSSGQAWNIHKKMLSAGLQPIVDCGIHYVEIMCQMTGSRPIRVNAMSARLSAEVQTPNYGQLQLEFADGSRGWYEAAYGPSISETAFFVKDVLGPFGSVSIVNKPAVEHAKKDVSTSADINSHTLANYLLVHHAQLNGDGGFAKADEWIKVEDEPGHVELCRREQEFFLEAIRNDIDLTDHMETAIESLKIVLAADESSRIRESVEI